jgi:hypothetical protein
MFVATILHVAGLQKSGPTPVVVSVNPGNGYRVGTSVLAAITSSCWPSASRVEPRPQDLDEVPLSCYRKCSIIIKSELVSAM